MKTFSHSYTKNYKGFKDFKDSEGQIHSEYVVVRSEEIVDAELNINDKLFNESMKKFNDIKGRMNISSFEHYINMAVNKIGNINNSTKNHNFYNIVVWSSNEGYANKNGYKKNVIKFNVLVEKTGKYKYSVKNVESERTTLYPKEHVSDGVYTASHETTLAHLKDMGFSIVGNTNSYIQNCQICEDIMTKLKGHLAPIKVG